MTNYLDQGSSGKDKGETEDVMLACKAPGDKPCSTPKTNSLVCCADADFKQIYPPLHAVLLLPPQFISFLGKRGVCQAAEGCQLSWELSEEPSTQGSVRFRASAP